jgi:hypothetical protein
MTVTKAELEGGKAKRGRPKKKKVVDVRVVEPVDISLDDPIEVKEATPEPAAVVECKCIVDKCYLDAGRKFYMGDTAMVPRDVAELLEKLGRIKIL